MPAADTAPQDNQDIVDTYDDAGYDASFSEFRPQQLDSSTFRQRNDPQELLYRYKLKLMNAYEVIKETEDPNTGKIVKKRYIKRKKDGKGNYIQARVNKQGVEDVMSYVETLINGHIVQGHIESMTEFRNKMKFIANDVTCHFIAKRTDWDCSIKDCDILISNTINLFDLFLTRTLFNEERKGYGESYKEETRRDIKPEVKQNVFQKVGGFLQGKGWG